VGERVFLFWAKAQNRNTSLFFCELSKQKKKKVRICYARFFLIANFFIKKTYFCASKSQNTEGVFLSIDIRA
jgi:hypothetical protein